VALLALGALAIVTLSLTGCGGEEHAATPTGKEVRAALTQAQRGAVTDMLPATGRIEAERSIEVSTRTMGWIETIAVDEGQSVQRGDPLVKIDDTDLVARRDQFEAAIIEAEAVLANAEKTAERFQTLYEEKSVSRQQLDDAVTGRDRARAGLDRARANLAEVEVQLTYTDIRAPSDGVVTRVLVEEGDMASPGTRLVNLEQKDRMKVVASVGEKDINRLRTGDTVTVTVTSLPDARYEVPIAGIIPAANPASRTFDVEAYLDNPEGRLLSGMFARMLIPAGTRETVLAPAAAVVERGQLRGFWIVDAEQRVHLRWVRLGRPQGEQVEVLSGLAGDETLVLSADLPLVEGDKVVP
jgi:RND family efflux transporter MFP subunit